LVTFAQDHDQIGNRAIGDRLTATLDYGQLAIAAVLTLAGPFTPMLFMGEEWGASTPWQFFTSHPEPELGKATAEGRIAEFEKMGWDPDVVPDPQDPDTFERSKLDWDESLVGDHARLLQVYRDLAELRRSRPELTDPRFDQIAASYSDADRWFQLNRGTISVLVNFSESVLKQTLETPSTLLLATDNGAEIDGAHVVLPPHSAVIVART
jgi:maltooligosyltrehalose trehalohydrolase